MILEQDRRAVSHVVEGYRQGFLALDPAALASLWDANHTALVYVAQEKEAPIVGWPAIKDYFDQLPKHLDAIDEMHIDDLAVT
jgi:hypothetical protein